MSLAGYKSPLLIGAIAVTAVAIAAVVGAPVRAQNLDQDMSAAKLFAASCADCHRSARGLAKGRLSFTLSYYLRQHYTSSAESAATLTAYLQSVDTPRTKAKQTAARKSPQTMTVGASARPPAAGASARPLRPLSIGASEPPLRPPASVPGR